MVDILADIPFACTFRFDLVLITTGLFHHIITNDDDLATVLGHEVAHVIAGHVLESKSIELADKYFTKPFSWLALLGWVCPEFIFFAAPILASSLTSLALSRVREIEADYIGLLLMADAGFNVSGAVSVWKKFNQWEERLQNLAKKGSNKRPPFGSTHPHVSFDFDLALSEALHSAPCPLSDFYTTQASQSLQSYPHNLMLDSMMMELEIPNSACHFSQTPSVLNPNADRHSRTGG
ncbi:peptidase family M48-domain-containing protein [Usnea florida]